MSNFKKAARPAAICDEAATPALPQAPTKAATVLNLLHRDQGATLAELIEATNWQPHTTRAMLTGLRKKGHEIDRRKRENVTCYYLPLADA